jgi:diaminopimelate decarboxylase
MNEFLKKILKNHILNNDIASFYFDLDNIREKIKTLKNLKTENLVIVFPVKSFPNQFFLDSTSDLFDGYDISNLNEYNLVNKLDHKEIVSSSPVRLDSLPRGISQEVQSIRENIESGYTIRLQVGEESRFGVPEDELTKEFVALSSGIHFHNQKWGEKPFDLIRSILNSFILRFSPPTMYRVNIGGGYGNMTFDVYAKELEQLCRDYPNLKFISEIGRLLVQDSGYLLGKVIDIQDVNTQKLSRVITNISKTCYLKWELQGAKFNVFSLVSKSVATKYPKVSFYGPTVFEGDQLVEFTNSKKIKLNDFIVIDNISGYGVAWNHSFNGTPIADVRFHLNEKIIQA